MSFVVHARKLLNLNRKIPGYALNVSLRNGSFAQRGFKCNCNPFLPGGGLEKLQGSPSEELYCNRNDIKLILKMRDQSLSDSPKNTTCAQDLGKCNQNTTDSKKTIEKHDSSSMNKYKIRMEELFFMNEEILNLRLLVQKIARRSDWFKAIKL